MIEYKLSIGDLRVSKERAVTFTCLGLGSCIGLFVQDRSTGISGGAHILMPDDFHSLSSDKHYSVKSAVNELLHQFKMNGSTVENLRAKITGGATISLSQSKTGELNIKNVVSELVQNKVYIAAAEVGGTMSRSAWFNCESGTLTIRKPEMKEYKTY